MKIGIVGRKTKAIEEKARALGMEITLQAPEAIVSHGGDGTLLGAERDYPGIPKIALRPDDEYSKCEKHTADAVLEAYAEGRLTRSPIVKLEARARGEVLTAINDVIVHNANVFSAVRFAIWIGETLYSQEIVGDGIVVATPFGSSAYYRSITHSCIRSGLGLAFNNSTEPIQHLVLDDKDVIRVQITRGPALLGADNNPHHVDLSEGDEVEIRKSDQMAVVLGVDTLLCNRCSRLKGGNRWNRHGGLTTI